MIHVQTLTEADLGRKIVFRADGASGPPEYATLIRFDHRRLYIRVWGDAAITTAKPIECTWAGA